MHCICISHCIVIHIHLACFCSVNCIHSAIIVHMLCIILLYSYLCLAFPSSSPKVIMKCESLHYILVSCVGYHGNSYKQTMLGLYNPFSRKWLKSHEHGTQCIVNKKGWSFLDCTQWHTHLGELIPSCLSNWLAWASFPCTKWPFPINSHAGEGFHGLEKLRKERKTHKGEREREK